MSIPIVILHKLDMSKRQRSPYVPSDEDDQSKKPKFEDFDAELAVMSPSDLIADNAGASSSMFISGDNESDSGLEIPRSTLSEDEEPLDNATLKDVAENTALEESEYDLNYFAKWGKKTGMMTQEEIEARRSKQLGYLNQFVNVSTKYSEFLEKKIAAQLQSISTAASSKSPNATSKQNDNISDKLKYFTGELRPYQLEGVQWLYVLFENATNGILADEMGLGKTIQIIALFAHLYEREVSGPFLVVAPLSTLGNWESEFKRFAPEIPVFRFQGSREERAGQMWSIFRRTRMDGRLVSPVVICSYQTPILEQNFLRRFKWQYVVVDEGHRIKNSESKLSQELRSLQSSNRTLLTGTPLQNNIQELWALFHFLMPDLFANETDFSALLELEDVKDTDKLLQTEARTSVIQTIHKVLAPFILRREKKFVLTDLVPKKEVVIYCSLTQMQNYIYCAALQKDVRKLLMLPPEKKKAEVTRGRPKRKCAQKITSYSELEVLDLDSEEYDVVDPAMDKLCAQKFVNKRVFRTKEHVPIDIPDHPYFCDILMTNDPMFLKKIVNHPYLAWYPMKPDTNPPELVVDEDLIRHSGKLIVLDALLPKLQARGHKVLIYSTLVMFLDMIEEMMIMRNYQYRRLDGSINYEERNERIGDFMNADANIFVFLLSTRAGGLGLNLTAADTVIFMDRDWNPMVDMQAQDRCHRIGQLKPVVFYSLITRSTIDELILQRGEMKKRLEKVVILEGKFKNLKKKFTGDELKELEQYLNREDKSTKVHLNGLMYTDEELNQIVDRSDLLKEMESLK